MEKNCLITPLPDTYVTWERDDAVAFIKLSFPIRSSGLPGVIIDFTQACVLNDKERNTAVHRLHILWERLCVREK